MDMSSRWNGAQVPYKSCIFDEIKVHLKTLCTIYQTNIYFLFLDVEENLNL